MAKVESKINYAGLKKVVQEMSKQYSVKVGLIAGQGGDEEISKDMDIAGIGAVQEYGAKIPVTDKLRNFFRYKFGVNLKKTTQFIEIPARSFLYAPIMDDTKGLRARIRKEIDKDGIEYVLEYKDFEFLAETIARAGYYQVMEAFENGGINGEWKPNSPITIEQKGSSKPLVNFGNLSGSISYKIEKSV